jgi:serine/threonine protein kinase
MLQDADHWEQLQALFHLAEETPDEELDELLLVACPDTELRQRAAALIRASRTKPEPGKPVDTPGRRIGPYLVLRHLGSGGIGTVYLVERTTAGVVQRAALKVLTRSAAGPFFVERFAREQQILASLDHPNITRLLDAGVSEVGEPYLTMEYVDGVHLDVYCDDRALGISERLHLFLRVCEAVAYAHRSLVVHLDLKPSNILVSEAGGIVKLLDFGTSKLIQPDSLLTTTVMATPAYASPEQLRNEPVTTVCDVYALGAILFELLSGRRPNQDSSVAAIIERSMKELPPESITAAVTAAAADHRGLTETRLRSMLTGDLATIVAKCITPRPRDRYVTVEALIVDGRFWRAHRRPRIGSASLCDGTGRWSRR